MPLTNESMEKISSYLPTFWNGIVIIACITGTVPFVKIPMRNAITIINVNEFK